MFIHQKCKGSYQKTKAVCNKQIAFFMYSCMTVMPNEKIGMLYEYGNGKITFIKYDKTQLIK